MGSESELELIAEKPAPQVSRVEKRGKNNYVAICGDEERSLRRAGAGGGWGFWWGPRWVRVDTRNAEDRSEKEPKIVQRVPPVAEYTGGGFYARWMDRNDK